MAVGDDKIHVHRRSSRYTLWKARRARFWHISGTELVD